MQRSGMAIVLLVAWTVAVARLATGQQPAISVADRDPDLVYACPMHPDVTATGPGSCPRCGMRFVLMDPFDAREYLLDVDSDPRTIRAGTPFRLQLHVREPRSGAPVREFATVHDRRFHLFVVSQDLTHYAHLHPDQHADGAWTLDVTLPSAGYYKLYADFLPVGGTPQVIAAALVTAGFGGDLASSSARLIADRRRTMTIDGMRVDLVMPGGGLVAGRDETLALRLTDARTGTPIADLEPYLAAWGHTLLISADTQAVVHAHPVEFVPENDPTARGGPTITFKALFPKAATYRLWTQMQRHGRIVTAMFTIGVASSAQP